MWREEKIGTELDVIRGVSFPKTAKGSEYQEGRVACLRTANVQKEVDWNDLWFIDKDHVNRKEQFVQVNDIIISTANSLELLGKVSLVRKLPYESTLGTFIVNIRVPDGNSPKFIYYQLCGRDFLEQVWDKASTTTNISNLSTTKLKDINLKFPPLPIQNRIVEKIEELFSELDNGVENLKKAQKQLKTYRQAVLKDAFEGKLTKEWREQQDDLPTPDELLEQIKAERNAHRERELAEWEKEVEQWEKEGKPGRKPRKPRKPKKLPDITLDELDSLPDLPSKWIYIRNQECIAEVKDGTHDTPDYVDKGIPFITQKNIKSDKVDFSDTRFISNEEHEKFYKRSNVGKGDIIIAMIGHNRGNSTIVNTDKTFSIKNVGLFKFYSEFQNNRFYLYYYRSQDALNQILSKSKGGAQPFIGLTELRKWPVIVCSQREQDKIVEEIESRLSVVDQLEHSIKENLQKAEALRQSILKKAFSGELIN